MTVVFTGTSFEIYCTCDELKMSLGGVVKCLTLISQNGIDNSTPERQEFEVCAGKAWILQEIEDG